eukprot:9621544-Alexandrium_andersonii.AAC.1
MPLKLSAQGPPAACPALPAECLSAPSARLPAISFATRSRGPPLPRRLGPQAMAAVAEERVCFQARK